MALSLLEIEYLREAISKMRKKLKDLEETQEFYIWKLKDKNLTEKDRDKYLKALKLIEKIIKEKERSGEKGKHKKFIPYEHRKAVFLNKRGY
jgi:NAD+--asparagine ADP-ribosyltransferase